MLYYIISRKRVTQSFTVTFVTNSASEANAKLNDYSQDLERTRLYRTHDDLFDGASALDRARAFAAAISK